MQTASFRSIGLLAVMFALSPSVRSYAQPLPPPEKPVLQALHVRGLAPCLKAESLAEHVQRWLEHDTVDARIDVYAEEPNEAPDTVQFSIVLSGGEPTARTLQDVPRDCAQRNMAVALSIALAMDAALTAEGKTVDEAPAAPRHAVDAPSAPAPAPSEVQPVYRMGLFVGADAGVVSRGLSPAVSWAGTYSASPWFALRAGVHASGQFGRSAGSVDATYDAQLLFGAVAACATTGASRSPWFAHVCAGGAAGAFHTQGHGFPNNQDVLEPWLAGEGSALIEYAVWKSCSIGAQLQLLVPLSRRRFAVTLEGGAQSDIAELPTVAAGISVGPIWRLF